MRPSRFHRTSRPRRDWLASSARPVPSVVATGITEWNAATCPARGHTHAAYSLLPHGPLRTGDAAGGVALVNVPGLHRGPLRDDVRRGRFRRHHILLHLPGRLLRPRPGQAYVPTCVAKDVDKPDEVPGSVQRERAAFSLSQ